MSSFSSTFSGAELDFRFADEMDIQDLKELIESYLLPLEQLTAIGGGGFRNPESPIITAAEVSDIYCYCTLSSLNIDSLQCSSLYQYQIRSWRRTWIA